MEEEPLLSHQEEAVVDAYLLTYMYVGHFLARWGTRTWEFSVGLYMINVWPDSLLLTATYGLVETVVTTLFGPLIGQWVDKLTYSKVLKIWLLTQNLSFVVAGATVVGVLMYPELRLTSVATFISLIVLINISGAVAVLSSLAGTILIEREWVVVISEGHPPSLLTKMNSIIRRIDLISKLFAPVATGFIISFVSLTASAVTLALWNITSVFLQYWLFNSVYKGLPSLTQRSLKITPPIELENAPEQARFSGFCSCNLWVRISESSYIHAWKVYLRQDVLLPGLALALLYFTVLSFGTLMTATLEWDGIPAYVIGTGRGISATIGIAATFVYPFMETRISTVRTGLWSIWSQWTCLLICVGSIWVQNNITSAYVLMAGVATSRLGLWVFDLSVIQQMQDRVSEGDRGVVGGVQNSIQSFWDLMTYIMAFIISDPKDFWKLIVVSFGLATMSAILYSVHILRVRKHIFHFEKLFMLFHRSI